MYWNMFREQRLILLHILLLKMHKNIKRSKVF